MFQSPIVGSATLFAQQIKGLSSGKDGDVVGLGLPFSTESEKESE